MNTDFEKSLKIKFDGLFELATADCGNALDRLTVCYDTEMLFTEKSMDEDISEHPVYIDFSGEFDRLFDYIASSGYAVYDCFDLLREEANKRKCEAFIEAMEAGLINPQDL